MDFYCQQILKIRETVYRKEYLYEKIMKAKSFMDQNFADGINLDDIKEKAAFSKFHFIRLFKTAYGRTPHQYLTAVRIDNAKQLLQNDMAIKQVCFSVGFYSLSAFTDLFKKTTGATPAEWQKGSKKIGDEYRVAPVPPELFYRKICELGK